MKLNNTDSIEETIIDEQIRNYFFRIGYYAKTMCDEQNFYSCASFIRKNKKIMNYERLVLAEKSYNSGLNHEFPHI